MVLEAAMWNWIWMLAALTAAPLAAQFSGLVTTENGADLYFSSTLHTARTTNSTFRIAMLSPLQPPWRRPSLWDGGVFPSILRIFLGMPAPKQRCATFFGR